MRRIILIIMVFVLLSPCVSCSPQSEPFVLPEITIPEQVDVDFRPFLMEDTGTSNNQQSERVLRLWIINVVRSKSGLAII